MTFHPLPVPTRIFGGEGLISYANRHAARNGTTIEEIERSLHEAGAIPKPNHRRTPERLQAWRTLGSLHESAFTTPAVLNGADVIDRTLCLRCTQGSSATGRLPRTGWVCAKHRRWLGTPQHDIRALPELVSAERHYRQVLAPRRVLARSALMEWAGECATTGIAPSTITARQQRSATSNPSMLTYPETVRIARLVTNPEFNQRMLQPGLSGSDRHAMSVKATTEIFPQTPDDESWRTAHRITAMFNNIAREIERNPSRTDDAEPSSTPLAQAWTIWGR